MRSPGELRAAYKKLLSLGYSDEDARDAIASRMADDEEAEVAAESTEQDRRVSEGPKDPIAFGVDTSRAPGGLATPETLESRQKVADAEAAKLALLRERGSETLGRSIVEGALPGATRNAWGGTTPAVMPGMQGAIDPSTRATMDDDYSKRRAVDVERGRVDQAELDELQGANPWPAAIGTGIGAVANPALPGSIAARGALKVLPKFVGFMGKLARGFGAGAVGGGADTVTRIPMQGKELTAEDVAAGALGGAAGGVAVTVAGEGVKAVARGTNSAIRQLSPWTGRALDAEVRQASNPRFRAAAERIHASGNKATPSDVVAEMADNAGEDMAHASDQFMKAEGKLYSDIEKPILASKPVVSAGPVKSMMERLRTENTTEVVPSRADVVGEFWSGRKPNLKGSQHSKETGSIIDEVMNSIDANADGNTTPRNLLTARRNLADKAFEGMGDPRAKRIYGSINEALDEGGLESLRAADTRFSRAKNSQRVFHDQTRTKGDAVDKDGNVGVQERRSFADVFKRTAEETKPGQRQSMDARRAAENPDLGGVFQSGLDDVTDAVALEVTQPGSTNKVHSTVTDLVSKIPLMGAASQNARALMRFTGRKAAQVAAKPQGISPFSMMSLSNKEQRKARK